MYVDTYKTLTGEKKALISAENFFKRLPEYIEYTRNMVKYYKGKLEEVKEKVESDLESKNIESILTEMNELKEVAEVVYSTHTPIEKQTVVVQDEWEKEKYDSLDEDYGYDYRTKKSYKKTPAKNSNKLWKEDRVAYTEYLECIKKAGRTPNLNEFRYGFLPEYKIKQRELRVKQEKLLRKQAKEEAKRLKDRQELEKFLKKNPTATEADFLETKKIKVVLVDRVAEQPDFIVETSEAEIDENATEEEKKALEVEKEEEKVLEKQAESDYNTAFVSAVLQDLPVEVAEEIVIDDTPKEKHRLCLTCMTSGKCERTDCKYAHTFSELTLLNCDENCKKVLVSNGKVVNQPVVDNNLREICWKRHFGECESEYLTRVKHRDYFTVKTMLCRQTGFGKTCRNGERCGYAHSYNELVMQKCHRNETCRRVHVVGGVIVNHPDFVEQGHFCYRFHFIPSGSETISETEESYCSRMRFNPLPPSQRPVHRLPFNPNYRPTVVSGDRKWSDITSSNDASDWTEVRKEHRPSAPPAERAQESPQKTLLCRNFFTSLGCKYSTRCRFAHSSEELASTMCKFGSGCNKVCSMNSSGADYSNATGQNYCSYFHGKESKDSYLNRFKSATSSMPAPVQAEQTLEQAPIPAQVEPRQKTILCMHFFTSRGCSRRECSFAHSLVEIAPVMCRYGCECTKVRTGDSAGTLYYNKRGEYCNRFHSEESKQSYLDRFLTK